LVVVGTSRNNFCTESDEGLKNDVVFTGYVPHDHLPSFYLLCDLFVSPSLQESFGMPILEAMACGVPVIVSSLEVFHEIAGEAAVYVSPTDPYEIAASIYTLIQDDSLRQRCVRLGKERAKAFTWESAAAKTLAAYHWAHEHPRQRGVVTF
jgi:glycosyltransferase involved in cell wall biosynthesis